LIARTVKEYGKVDILINNAGVGMWTRFDSIQDLGIFERLMKVNYLSGVYCTLYARRYLKQSRGRIVGVSSLAGKTGAPERSGYAASKHAMVGFFDALRIELLGSGVSVTIAYPDYVATGGRGRNLGADGKPVVNFPPYGKNAMTNETCARLILEGVARRDREIVLTMRGRVGPWVKLTAPALADRAARRASARGQ
jgi:short-subunit dehydrogenase